MKTLKQYTKRELIDAYKEQYDLIYGEASCYNGNDLRLLDALASELDRRGITFKLQPSFNE